MYDLLRYADDLPDPGLPDFCFLDLCFMQALWAFRTVRDSQRVPGTSAQKLVPPVQLACKPVYRPVCQRGQQLR